VARVLIVGCGCRGRVLARDLRAAGHAVRGTTRDAARTAAIAEAGVEPYVGDPDRIATLMEALSWKRCRA
jgi:Trk K+ transport system NAD-binding subunit